MTEWPISREGRRMTDGRFFYGRRGSPNRQWSLAEALTEWSRPAGTCFYRVRCAPFLFVLAVSAAGTKYLLTGQQLRTRRAVPTPFSNVWGSQRRYYGTR